MNKLFRYTKIFLIFLLVIELMFIILAWTKYGGINGILRPYYEWVNRNIIFFITLILIIYNVSLFGFGQGVGISLLVVSLYRVIELCQNNKNRYD
jgi:hypothetical protein